jgi:sterol desaturase/sphingolipid hydroxylase (fatty acid hydroxylase superfamily)
MHSEKDYPKFHPFQKGVRIFGMAIIGVITAIFFGLLFGYFVELLWNWLMPSVFKLGKITYWQAFGLVLMARLIFGSIGHDHGGGRYHRDYHHPYYYWRRNCDIRGINWRDWEYYDSWWREEGKTAFENYIAKVEHKNGES